MNKEKSVAYLGLLVYITLGILVRYFTTIPCGSAFEPIHNIVKPWAIIFIVIGIVFGLISFIYRNKTLTGRLKNLKDVAQGAVTGFSIGYGGTSVILLIFNLCS